jgi:condensin-2 complex subunit G2
VTDCTALPQSLSSRACLKCCSLCVLYPALFQSFHDVQRAKLDAALLRIYDPILWRSLRCANAQVRAQAAVFFLDVFPLQHAEGRAEDNDRILQKQFDLLASLLTDSDHNVRAHAALGVCHILKEYWESLPVNTTHNILKYLIDTLSCDVSCANVRHAVFVGLNELFQQPLAHAVLKQLLPLLQNSIHDKSEKVRVAFIRILCQVRILLLHFSCIH